MMHATWWTLAHFISVGLFPDACWLPKLQPDLWQFSPNTDPKKPLRKGRLEQVFNCSEKKKCELWISTDFYSLKMKLNFSLHRK